MQNKATDKIKWDALLAKVGEGLMVRTDSREVCDGDVFVAISGPLLDGTDFIPKALENGASYIVCANEVDTKSAELIIHDSPHEALGELATAYFKTDQNKIKLIGITGTNGKTTVAYLIEQLLSCAGMKVGVLGTVSYRWPGYEQEAPLTTPGCWKIHELLAEMSKAKVDVAVMEVSSHALDQKRVAGLKFDAAVITNVTQDHLDYHGDMETYFKAKCMLFKHYPNALKRGIINFDDPYGRRLLECYSPSIGFGLKSAASSDENSLCGEMVSCTGHGMQLKMRFGDKEWQIESDLIGRFNGSNLLAAQAVGLHLGLAPEQMDAFAKFDGVPGRLERVRNKQGFNIFVDYAHTPDALDNVLRTLRDLNFKRIITVFGCGGDRDKVKRPIMAEAACRYSDVAVLTSDNPRTEDPLQIIEDVRPGLKGCAVIIEDVDRSAAIRKAVAEMNIEDVLLIAGKGHETYQIIGTEKRDFSDSEEVMKAIKEIYG
ncbi:UDP-N-acetylmuramoyl-L-alanyl-D-glutamate--2,6-diaminopimelate ligase [Maridesulfovibrio hydrothermalis]|uniref:UDP-N-acetylmuramoyl-L-alanyl-D-glutamate--2,6-diaminopimelate ligase n=1 Tax=Maridesulfovibrio hydrothermalis AM13 = DSM 14728 TaxID=1121451 RepID=L0RAB2_9BACT|nr:UDP-N-acetylmuramoyl-L-alanyl-D-glutamate--2,6-diaminopimelate ligase [Maridesulfovibrio hydrothermalis]CCO22496.1 UDP-N-acetylmuramoylalanyl-D-glutamate-2, 6-diaminopimelate ligase [Maridesulfovibrio hydrothermalis AM13 = DSM 14728]